MKMKLLSLIGVATLVACLSANAGKYMVYKGSYLVEKYKKSGSNYTFDKKNDKLKFVIYMVVPTSSTSTESIQRIVFVKTKTKYSPVDTSKKATNKLLIDPTVDIDAQYSGTAVDAYLDYAGEWDTATILGAGGSDKSYYIITDYYKSSSKLGNDDTQGYAEFYSGKLKSGVAKSLKGAISYYDSVDGEYVISRKAQLKYDKKLSAKESSIYNADSIEDAAEAVVSYLVGKKYASTWKE